VANQAYAIRVPMHMQEGRGQAERALTGVPPPDSDDGAPVDVEHGAVAICAQTLDWSRRAQQTVSLDRVSGQDDAAPAETVPDLDAPSPFDVAINRLLR
jgi:hypothetical protein